MDGKISQFSSKFPKMLGFVVMFYKTGRREGSGGRVGGKTRTTLSPQNFGILVIVFLEIKLAWFVSEVFIAITLHVMKNHLKAEHAGA